MAVSRATGDPKVRLSPLSGAGMYQAAVRIVLCPQDVTDETVCSAWTIFLTDPALKRKSSPMNNLKAEFLVAAFNADQFPNRDLPEVAFVGRSNVGKSSLVNTLIGRKGIAKVSATPGRTQSINFILISEKWLLVDVPGYGFAKVPRAVQASWQTLVDSYLIGRKALQGVVQIIDIRLEPQESDVQMLEFLLAQEIPVMLVGTKADKVSRAQANKTIAAWVKLCGIKRDHIVLFSAVTGEGRELLWRQLYDLLSAGDETMREVRKARERENLSRKAEALQVPPPPPASVATPTKGVAEVSRIVITSEDGSW